MSYACTITLIWLPEGGLSASGQVHSVCISAVVMYHLHCRGHTYVVQHDQAAALYSQRHSRCALSQSYYHLLLGRARVALLRVAFKSRKTSVRAQNVLAGTSMPVCELYLELCGIRDLCNGLNNISYDLCCLGFRDDAEERSQLGQKLSERLSVLLLSKYIAEPLNGLQNRDNLSVRSSHRDSMHPAVTVWSWLEIW